MLVAAIISIARSIAANVVADLAGGARRVDERVQSGFEGPLLGVKRLARDDRGHRSVEERAIRGDHLSAARHQLADRREAGRPGRADLERDRAHERHAVDQDRADEVRLRREVAKQRPLRDPGARGDLARADVDPALRERVGRRLEQQPPIALSVRAKLLRRRAHAEVAAGSVAAGRPSTATCATWRARRNVTSTTSAISISPAATMNAMRKPDTVAAICAE